MKEADRIEALTAHADYLLGLPQTLTETERGQLKNIAHALKKFQQFVLDRDAGPSSDVKSENTKLQATIDTTNSVLKEVVDRHNGHIDMTKAMRQEVPQLRQEIRDKGKRITELELELAMAKKVAAFAPIAEVPVG